MRNSVEIGKIIKTRRAAMNLKQTDFADRLGIHKSTVSKYEKGLRKIPMEDIGKMADVLGISIEDLLLEKQPETEVPTIQVSSIPVVSKVSAGMPVFAEQNIVDYIYLPANEVKPGKDVFGLIVDGDSMNKEFREGDIVIIEKDSTVENGQIGVVMINGYNGTLKRVKYINDSVLLMPESTNPEHEPQIYNNQDEVIIIGKVVGMHRKF